MKDYLLKSPKEAVDYILKLARKLGSTPSEKIFYENSGMKLYPLQKLGFPTYGHLVRKAKLAPNKFDKTRYTEEFLIKEFIKMIKKNNKWPTKAELDYKHFNDPNFPTSGTFYKKFGLVSGMAEKILDYTFGKNKYEDIERICNKALNSSGGLPLEKDKGLRNGYVYIFKNGNRPEYKIGMSKDVLRRGKQLSTSTPKDYKLIHLFEVSISPRAVEIFLHDRFRDKRINREWFNLSSGDIEWIKKWDGNIF